ncbi:hypothetical protein [Algoriphagus sp.]|uniref:hypothetical protein n=1 Tax=Algoriphagus sp. TaxID=1872435 RepID=UPI0025E339CF|nr:hypothetical protein [Algoriphagus sp.]
MKRFNFLFIPLIILFTGCQEDAEKFIETDLPTEAAQLFNISTAWSESLYFALITFEEFQAIDSTSSLPGCPNLIIENDTRKVFLDFDIENECLQTGTKKRSGKLILEFSLVGGTNPTWVLEYDNYSFDGNRIRGIRTFRKDISNDIIENFNPITFKTEKDLTTVFTGNLKHKKGITNSIGIISGGIITGKNAAGREFSIDIPFNRLMLSTCFQNNELIPVTGTETWIIERGSNKKAIHELKYELIDSCNVAANVLLSDGRKLLLNP